MAVNSDYSDEIRESGLPVAVLDTDIKSAEKWVRAIEKEIDIRVAWSCYNGLIHILHLGDNKSRAQVIEAVDRLKNQMEGEIIYTWSLELEQGWVGPDGRNMEDGPEPLY
jgi:hypothetical protein